MSVVVMLFNKPHGLGEWMGRWLFEAGEDFKDFEAYIKINNNRKLLLNRDNICRKEWGNFSSL